MCNVNFQNLKTLVFDCDGVILNSNQLKTDAFRAIALPLGQKAADELVRYHLLNGGMSRYQKFFYFIEQIVPKYIGNSNLSSSDYPTIENLSVNFANHIRGGLMNCDIASGLKELRKVMKKTSWIVVSGADQEEIRNVLNKRGVAHYFDAGIFGSPDNKDQIFKRELNSGLIAHPAMYLGDSFYDFCVAQRVGVDFIYVSGWSEISNQATFRSVNQLKSVNALVDLIAIAR